MRIVTKTVTVHVAGATPYWLTRAGVTAEFITLPKRDIVRTMARANESLLSLCNRLANCTMDLDGASLREPTHGDVVTQYSECFSTKPKDDSAKDNNPYLSRINT
jgi:hypothetical protein